MIDDLPSAMPGGKAAFCDPCSKRGQNKMSARVYCSVCDMKLCAKHEQVKSDIVTRLQLNDMIFEAA